MTKRELLDAVGHLGVHERNGQRAPHKPLLLLWILGHLQQGGTRLVEFNDLEEPLRTLLERFGHPRSRNHPEYPFWWLRTDGLWEVPGGDGLPRRGSGKEPRIAVIREQHVEGGLPAPIDRMFRADPALVAEVALRLLFDHFPESLHEEILESVGLDLHVRTSKPGLPRDPEFARRVLRAYDSRCAMCGFQATLGGRLVGIDAAHVMWHCRGGPSSMDNGLALCGIHHRLFDLGALGISGRNTVLISSFLVDSGASGIPLVSLRGVQLRGPKVGFPGISPKFQEWHQREVFRDAAKAAG